MFVKPKVNVDLLNLSSLIDDVFLDLSQLFFFSVIGNLKSWEKKSCKYYVTTISRPHTVPKPPRPSWRFCVRLFNSLQSKESFF